MRISVVVDTQSSISNNSRFSNERFGNKSIGDFGFSILILFYIDDIVMAVSKNLVDFTVEILNSLHDRLKFSDKTNFLDIN